MSKTVKRVSIIITSLILGVFLSGSAYSGTVEIGATGDFTYTLSTNTISITGAIVTRSDFNLLEVGDSITLTASVGTDGTMNFEGVDVITATENGVTFTPTGSSSLVLTGGYQIAGGAWINEFETDFSSLMTFTLFDGQSIATVYSTGVGTGKAEISFTLASVPVPSSLLLIGFGLMMLTGYRRKSDL